MTKQLIALAVGLLIVFGIAWYCDRHTRRSSRRKGPDGDGTDYGGDGTHNAEWDSNIGGHDSGGHDSGGHH